MSKVEAEATFCRFLSRRAGHVGPDDKIQTSAFNPKGSTGPGDSGPSVFVLDRLEKKIEDLEAANPPWKDYGYATANAGAVQAAGVALAYTPEECQFPSVKHAHASVTNLTKDLRLQLIQKLELKRAPR